MKKLLYIKISEQIMNDIVSGNLKSGSKIKSVREMALELKVNPKTVQKAFDYLDEKNIFISQVGEGRFVTDDKDILNTIKKEVLEEEINSFLYKMSSYNLSYDDIIKIIENKK